MPRFLLSRFLNRRFLSGSKPWDFLLLITPTNSPSSRRSRCSLWPGTESWRTPPAAPRAQAPAAAGCPKTSRTRPKRRRRRRRPGRQPWPGRKSLQRPASLQRASARPMAPGGSGSKSRTSRTALEAAFRFHFRPRPTQPDVYLVLANRSPGPAPRPTTTCPRSDAERSKWSQGRGPSRSQTPGAPPLGVSPGEAGLNHCGWGWGGARE